MVKFENKYQYVASKRVILKQLFPFGMFFLGIMLLVIFLTMKDNLLRGIGFLVLGLSINLIINNQSLNARENAKQNPLYNGKVLYGISEDYKTEKNIILKLVVWIICITLAIAVTMQNISSVVSVLILYGSITIGIIIKYIYTSINDKIRKSKNKEIEYITEIQGISEEEIVKIKEMQLQIYNEIIKREHLDRVINGKHIKYFSLNLAVGLIEDRHLTEDGKVEFYIRSQEEDFKYYWRVIILDGVGYNVGDKLLLSILHKYDPEYKHSFINVHRRYRKFIPPYILATILDLDTLREIDFDYTRLLRMQESLITKKVKFVK